jgi:hypothetical protein
MPPRSAFGRGIVMVALITFLEAVPPSGLFWYELTDSESKSPI